MRRVVIIFSLYCLIFLALSLRAEAAVPMTNYCTIPPYVSQNVPPNIMLLVDNSGSMNNLAYACPLGRITTAGTNITTAVFTVDDGTGFKPNQRLALNHTNAGVTSTQVVWLSSVAVDNTNPLNPIYTITLTVPATISTNDTIQDYGCSGTLFYEQGNTTSVCPTHTTTCNSVSGGDTTVYTGYTNSSSTTIYVNSNSNFVCGEDIIVYHSNTAYKRTLASSSCTGTSSGKPWVLVTSSVTYSAGDVVRDFCKYYASSGIISVNDDTGFSVGQTVVLYHNSAPVALTITAIDTSANTFTVTPVASVSGAVSKGDTIYDYNCFYYDNPYPEESFSDTKEYYGYFDTSAWYTYNTTSAKFVKSVQKSARAKLATEWDGNFLNWLTMRRMDIVRKAFTGGRNAGGEAAGLDKLYGIKPDYTGRGVYKAVAQAEKYTGLGFLPNTNTTMNFTFTTSGATTWSTTTPGSFSAESGNAGALYTAKGSFNVSVVVPTPVEGVLQDVVSTRARLGLTVYAGDQGGKVIVNVGDFSLANTVNAINGVAITNAEGGTNYTAPLTNTPLGEALWTVVGYFQQYSTADTTNGPLYNNSGTSASYKVGNTYDPLNYGTATTPKYLSCATNYVLVVTDGEPYKDGSLPASIKNITGSPYLCTDGNCPAVAPLPGGPIQDAGTGGNVADGSVSGVEKVALYGHMTNLRPDVGGFQNLNMYFVFAFGSGSSLLTYAAINGGYDIGSTPSNQASWDNNHDNVPDSYFEASDPNTLEPIIRDALSTVLKRAASGTSASVLASGEGSGANLIQAVFYPKKRIGNDIIGWAGSLQNLWYYVDPFFKNSQIREDTVGDEVLNLTNDYISQLYFDNTLQQTRAKLFSDANGDGAADSATPVATKSFEQLKYLWEAGVLLWGRTEAADPRKIYTGIGSGLIDFSLGNEAALQPYLNLTDRNGDGSLVTEGNYLIRAVRGDTLTSTTDADGNVTPGVDQDGDGTDDFRNTTVTIGGGMGTWKLGDVIESTPRISSWLPQNNYHLVQQDITYGPASDPRLEDPADNSMFVTQQQYKNRGMVFVGSNDGMLHAFKLGQLQLVWSGQQTSEKARLWNREAGVICQASSDGSDPGKNACGREIWSFIPKNALPYLNYVYDPDYCHIYTVNLTPFIFDASIETTGCAAANYWDCPKSASSWKTILIGGMRTGGACRQTAGTCNSKNCSVTMTTSCTQNSDCPATETCVPNCVNTPITVGGSDVGYSSYFALDVTDQNNPTLLWEFSDPRLGFSTTGPAIVRVNAYNGSGSTATTDKSKVGRWFVIFGSGPTGPIDTASQQFLGRSDQNLKFFIFDLKTGPGANNANVTVKDTGIANAFAGNMMNSAVDNDLDYQDDAIYVGYTSMSGATWTNGGVGRLRTGKGIAALHPEVSGNWQWDKVIDNVGPVTTAVARLQNSQTNTLWLFFGTGRYFYNVTTTPDDNASNRQIFGIKDPCFVADPSTNKGRYDDSCPSPLSGVGSPLTNVTNVANVTSSPDDPAFKGWYINLDPLDNAHSLGAERAKSDPVALTSGLVLFTTLKPYNSVNPCLIGGQSLLWAVKYNTGGSGGALLKGKAIVQLSTGAIEQVDMSQAFNDPGTGNRRTSTSMEGIAPGGISFISSPPPVKKVVHIRER